MLVLHGHDDPMVPVEQVNGFEDEMTKAKADWQLNVYSQTMHGFTNPKLTILPLVLSIVP